MYRRDLWLAAGQREMLESLSADFEAHPDSVLHFNERQAMARGSVDGIQIPEFVICLTTLKQGLLTRGCALEVMPVFSGRSETPWRDLAEELVFGSPTPHDQARFGLEYFKGEAVHGPLAPPRQRKGYRQEVMQHTNQVLPAALEAKPLTIDRRIANLLVPSVVPSF